MILGKLVKLSLSWFLYLENGDSTVYLFMIDITIALVPCIPGAGGGHGSRAGRKQISPQTTVLCPSRGERQRETRGEKEVRKEGISVNLLDCDNEAKVSFYENHI